MTSQFAFLRREWPEVFDSAARCELAVHREPRAACFYARRVLELALHWAFKADAATNAQVRQSLADLLQQQVASMNLDDFVARPHRRLVEQYAKPEAWLTLTSDASAALSHDVAGLPTTLEPEGEEAKRFDLDREAAKQALASFLAGKTLSANQIDFVNLVVDHLTEHGTMEARRLYESPFTDLTPRGPEGLFSASSIDQLIAALDDIRRTALAA